MLQGSELDHMDLRSEAVNFMREHPDDFAPYMEDEEDFGSYCNRMSKVQPTKTASAFRKKILCLLGSTETKKNIFASLQNWITRKKAEKSKYQTCFLESTYKVCKDDSLDDIHKTDMHRRSRHTDMGIN